MVSSYKPHARLVCTDRASIEKSPERFKAAGATHVVSFHAPHGASVVSPGRLVDLDPAGALLIPDMTAPTLRQLETFVAAVRALPEGATVVASCKAGCGRTGTFAAAFLIETEGLIAKEAIERVRRIGAKHAQGWNTTIVETPAQERVLREFEASRKRGA